MRIGVIVCCYNEKGEILLIKRKDYHYWTLPGGCVNQAETLEEACRREVLEETGIHVGSIQARAVYKQYLPADETFLFKGTAESGRIQLSNETVDVGFFSKSKSLSMVPRFVESMIQDDGLPIRYVFPWHYPASVILQAVRYMLKKRP